MRAITPTAVRPTTVCSVPLRIGISVAALGACVLAAALAPDKPGEIVGGVFAVWICARNHEHSCAPLMSGM